MEQEITVTLSRYNWREHFRGKRKDYCHLYFLKTWACLYTDGGDISIEAEIKDIGGRGWDLEHRDRREERQAPQCTTGRTGIQVSRQRLRGFSKKHDKRPYATDGREEVTGCTFTNFFAKSCPFWGALLTQSGTQTCTREGSLTFCKAPWLRGGQPVTLSSSAPASPWVPWPWEKDCASTAGTTQPPHSEGSLVTQSITLKTTGGFQNSREQYCCFLGMTNRFGLLNKFSAKTIFFF